VDYVEYAKGSTINGRNKNGENCNAQSNIRTHSSLNVSVEMLSPALYYYYYYYYHHYYYPVTFNFAALQKFIVYPIDVYYLKSFDNSYIYE